MLDFSLICNAFNVQQPKPFLLPLDVRQKLHELGWTEIHFSDMSRGSVCAWQQYMDIIMSRESGNKMADVRKQVSAYALCGNVMHEAFDNYEDTCCLQADGVTMLGNDPWYWRQLFKKALANERNEGVIYTHNGTQVTQDDINLWSDRLASRQTYGITMAEMIRRIRMPMEEQGWQFVDHERVITYVDGEGTDYPIVFKGTVDVVAVFRGMVFIFDLKGYGIFRVLFDGKGSVKNVPWTTTQVQYMRQLRHYHWLYHMATDGEPVDGTGLMLPAACIPYKSNGKNHKKGDQRGSPVISAPVLPHRYVMAYQKDLIKQITIWARHGFVRDYPTNFGKPICPDYCSYFQACLGDSKNAIGSDQEAVLAQYR
jgi:hypothetical protein